MLKYLYNKVVFAEIPDEVTLAIAISGCRIHCDGCHSKELWEDTGKPLSTSEIDRLLGMNEGVTCLLLLGGESDIDSLKSLFKHAFGRIKTAWYSGLDALKAGDRGILRYLDYYKEGHYDKKLGGLDSPTTNQKLFEVVRPLSVLKDITFKLQKANL